LLTAALPACYAHATHMARPQASLGGHPAGRGFALHYCWRFLRFPGPGHCLLYRTSIAVASPYARLPHTCLLPLRTTVSPVCGGEMPTAVPCYAPHFNAPPLPPLHAHKLHDTMAARATTYLARKHSRTAKLAGAAYRAGPRKTLRGAHTARTLRARAQTRFSSFWLRTTWDDNLSRSWHWKNLQVHWAPGQTVSTALHTRAATPFTTCQHAYKHTCWLSTTRGHGTRERRFCIPEGPSCRIL